MAFFWSTCSVSYTHLDVYKRQDVDSENSRAGDDIIIPVKNIMNEAYCRELSKKLRKQFQIQRGNGEFLGAFANYGYCKSPDDKHKLVAVSYTHLDVYKRQ